MSDTRCLWSHADQDTDMWETSCNNAFVLIDGTPHQNCMVYCPYCGKILEEDAPLETGEPIAEETPDADE